MRLCRPAQTVKHLALCLMLALTTTVAAAPAASAQAIDAEADAASVQLLFDAIDALSDGDNNALAQILATAVAGEIWLPRLGIDAIADRDPETLVLGTELLAADHLALEDFVFEHIDYELELLTAVQSGDSEAREELGWADEEGQAVQEVAERRGLVLSADARAALGPLSALGGAQDAPLSMYEDVLDELEIDDAPGSQQLWLIGVGVLPLLGLLYWRGQRSKRLANTDALTGLSNRRQLDHDVDRRRSTKGSTAVLMIDIDHFKVFNDTHGHAVGDEVLRHVGAALDRTFRKEDVPYRYGGEEFCVLLPTTSEDQARQAGERARLAIAAIELSNAVKVTASIGVAVQPTSWISDTLEAADRALYAAKENGRNRVEVDDDTSRGPEIATKVTTF